MTQARAGAAGTGTRGLVQVSGKVSTAPSEGPPGVRLKQQRRGRRLPGCSGPDRGAGASAPRVRIRVETSSTDVTGTSGWVSLETCKSGQEIKLGVGGTETWAVCSITMSHVEGREQGFAVPNPGTEATPTKVVKQQRKKEEHRTRSEMQKVSRSRLRRDDHVGWRQAFLLILATPKSQAP